MTDKKILEEVGIKEPKHKLWDKCTCEECVFYRKVLLAIQKATVKVLERIKILPIMKSGRLDNNKWYRQFWKELEESDKRKDLRRIPECEVCSRVITLDDFEMCEDCREKELKKATTDLKKEILEIIDKKIKSLEKEFNEAEGDTDFTFDLRVRIMDIEEIKKTIKEG